MRLIERMTESEEWETHRRSRMPMLARGAGHDVRFPICGDAVEGFEIWLPEPLEVVMSSLLVFRCNVELDCISVEPEIIVGRFLRRP